MNQEPFLGQVPAGTIAMGTEVAPVSCECCGLEEDCTGDYISDVRARFAGRWLCGLCSEAVMYEAGKRPAASGMDEAVRAHMAFCGALRRGPAERVAEGMRQMLRSASVKSSSSSSPRVARRSSPVPAFN